LIYSITVLTVSTRIPTDLYDAALVDSPWSGDRAPIVFDDPVLSTIRISDDDPNLEMGFYTPSEDDQKLVEPATIGFGDSAVTLPAGTALTNYVGSVIGGADGSRFVLLFPRTFEADGFGVELGDRHSVLVIPMARTIDGVSRFPVFDPSQPLTYITRYDIGPSLDALPYAIPCFAEGSLIRTSNGPRPVEALRVGDLLETLDHGLRPILWLGSRHADRAHLDLRPQDRPIRLAAGALGPGCPLRDLVVSPQHRMLMRSAIAARMLGSAEALVAARHLLGQPGITVDGSGSPVTYWHILMARHEVIQAEGAWTESLYPGPVALQAFSPAQVAQIHAVLPDLALTGPPSFARPVPTGRQARQLSHRHLRNAKPLMRA